MLVKHISSFNLKNVLFFIPYRIIIKKSYELKFVGIAHA